MKKFISIFILFLIIPMFNFSQSTKVKKLLKDIENEWKVDDNGNITYVQVVEAKNLSAEKIYANVKDYFTYKYPKADKLRRFVIQSDDKVTGRIVGKGLWKDVHVGISLISTWLDCWHILRVDVKEGQARIMLTLTDYEHKTIATKDEPTFNKFKVNNSFPCNPRGLQKTVMGKAFYKSHKLALGTIAELEKSIIEADQFTEYAMIMLKDAFGDDFDEIKAIEEFYMGGEIKKRYYFNENNEYEGLYESWFKNGEIKEQYFYRNGVLEGDFKVVIPLEALNDSVPNDIGYEYGSYKNGLVDGRYQIKGRDGSLGKDGFFKNGKREGLWKVYHWRSSEALSIYSYSSKIRMKLVYKDGIIYNEECFDKNGYKIECN